ncbi:SDR family NAD(P)-dependent oxidoreductase [Cyclobacterium xiamenense]|uniref:SDR family NAD(P)-dependent oxidoreductase n=1 Tax=Cyclobacterium xiamenense TaxID=1297121 RepID=UPI0012B7449E|nr:SDR family oxidoreductase [Cyclobacterium xiamenense]
MRKQDPYSLVGKTILITGASSGIGRSIAIQSAQKRAKLLLMGRDQERLKETLSMCKNGCKHQSISLDFTVTQGWQNEIEQVLSEHAPLDGMVHAAGISPTIPLKIAQHQQLLNTFELNVFSCIKLIQLLTRPGIKNKRGMSFVLLASVMSEAGEKGKFLYSMSKAALVAASRSLALEYAAQHMRFNCISPGVVNSPLSEKSVYRGDPEAMQRMLARHPLGLGEVADVAHAAVYLLSDASKWMTGSNMVVDGGYLAQ